MLWFNSNLFNRGQKCNFHCDIIQNEKKIEIKKIDASPNIFNSPYDPMESTLTEIAEPLLLEPLHLPLIRSTKLSVE